MTPAQAIKILRELSEHESLAMNKRSMVLIEQALTVLEAFTEQKQEPEEDESS